MNMDNFKLTTRSVKSIQETRIRIGNSIHGSMVEELIRDSKLYDEIRQMRKNKKANRKKIALLIKKALIEVGKSKEQLESEFKLRKRQDPFYIDLLKLEKVGIKILEGDLEKMPLYLGYCKQVRGLGALTSAQLIAIIGDMTRFLMPSSLWHYFGVGDPNEDKLSKGKEATHNPKGKALLLGVIAENFVKLRSQYRVIYEERKVRTLKTHPEWHNLNPDGTKNEGKNMHPRHAEKDARRVMMKRFLCEFWRAGYLAKGLMPPCNPYILNNPKHHLDPDIVSYKLEKPIKQ